MRISGNQEFVITLEMFNEALVIIEDMCLTIVNRKLSQLGLSAPNRQMNNLFNKEMKREQRDDVNKLITFINLNLPKLNREQRYTYICYHNASCRKQKRRIFLNTHVVPEKRF